MEYLIIPTKNIIFIWNYILKRRLNLSFTGISGLAPRPRLRGNSHYLHQYCDLSLCPLHEWSDKVLCAAAASRFSWYPVLFPLGKPSLPLLSMITFTSYCCCWFPLSLCAFFFVCACSVCLGPSSVYRSRAAVHLGTLQPGGEQAQKSLRQRHRLRPLPCHPGSHRG